MRPVIGISAYAEQARWGEAWDLPAVLLPRAYADQVADAGGVPVLLPPLAGVGGAVERLDGLLLAGGGDIDPGRYGAPTDARTAGVRGARDTAEIELLEAALARGLPVLGVCRGMQLLNVVRGGTLNQHLPDLVGHHGHRERVGVFGTHPVTVAEFSRTADVLGRTELEVPTYHHQSLAELGEDVTATAWADDGTVEAIEYTDRFNVLGVQWHPEMGKDPSLFQWLVERASGSDRG
ncbi:gamma-glutamyl-gamma-aminobutyrate hydrolase family protein [Nocardiopsis sp. EMB25]|uniref:gamma-glutamyl-gamma-aminobutyrate hydrolase family protein n=1 Tax=Nocardiopsis TaxID=2013 RepID=UPI00034CED73|nr:MULTISPECIES: gamma-glutamyl-gamma-aminobutyrate hydrolase family protein [Nocardiopsis]MCY9783358.1 gamma-glutamyl-gamma-aminobutyrate hydrolase family protein [Nocardiopsis sp. EMB25]